LCCVSRKRPPTPPLRSRLAAACENMRMSALGGFEEAGGRRVVYYTPVVFGRDSRGGGSLNALFLPAPGPLIQIGRPTPCAVRQVKVGKNTLARGQTHGIRKRTAQGRSETRRRHFRASKAGVTKLGVDKLVSQGLTLEKKRHAPHLPPPHSVR
jgi:hypothetical protein